MGPSSQSDFHCLWTRMDEGEQRPCFRRKLFLFVSAALLVVSALGVALGLSVGINVLGPEAKPEPLYGTWAPWGRCTSAGWELRTRRCLPDKVCPQYDEVGQRECDQAEDLLQGRAGNILA